MLSGQILMYVTLPLTSHARLKNFKQNRSVRSTPKQPALSEASPSFSIRLLTNLTYLTVSITFFQHWSYIGKAIVSLKL